jgi:hypothetical protein
MYIPEEKGRYLGFLIEKPCLLVKRGVLCIRLIK